MAGEPEKPEQRPAPAQAGVELQLLDMLDRLRDSFNLQIELTMRDIRRLLKNKEDK